MSWRIGVNRKSLWLTTEVLETKEGTRMAAGGTRDLSPAQRAALQPGEVAAKLPKAHAEVTALDHAAKNGLTPSRISTSNKICPDCARAVERSGGKVTHPKTATWPD